MRSRRRSGDESPARRIRVRGRDEHGPHLMVLERGQVDPVLVDGDRHGSMPVIAIALR